MCENVRGEPTGGVRERTSVLPPRIGPRGKERRSGGGRRRIDAAGAEPGEGDTGLSVGRVMIGPVMLLYMGNGDRSRLIVAARNNTNQARGDKYRSGQENGHEPVSIERMHRLVSYHGIMSPARGLPSIGCIIHGLEGAGAPPRSRPRAGAFNQGRCESSMRMPCGRSAGRCPGGADGSGLD